MPRPYASGAAGATRTSATGGGRRGGGRGRRGRRGRRSGGAGDRRRGRRGRPRRRRAAGRGVGEPLGGGQRVGHLLEERAGLVEPAGGGRRLVEAELLGGHLNQLRDRGGQSAARAAGCALQGGGQGSREA